MAALIQARASERVVVLLRPREKQKLVRAARREKVSAAELLRRSLDAYLSSPLSSEGDLLTRMGASLNLVHATLEATNARIEARLKESERLLQDPAHLKRLAQLDDFIARHQKIAKPRGRGTKAA